VSELQLSPFHLRDEIQLHTISGVMTIREKFADLSYLVSKYKDNHMALLLGVGVSWNKLRAGDKPTSFFIER